MSLPKEPRQKMINMMYLVLTALLALNVSSEILNAFKTVNSSLEKSNGIVTGSTNDIMKSFERKLNDASSAEQAKIWFPKAQQALGLSKGPLDFIVGLKRQILEKAGADYAKGDSSFKEDNLDIATRLMVEQGRGKELFNMLKKYRDDLLNVDPAVKGEFEKSLPIDLSMPKTQNKGNNSWEAAYFRMVPTVAAITMLSKFENDVRTAENRVVTYLHNKVGQVELIPDTYAAIVGQSSNYVLPGEQIEISAGVGAFNKKVAPSIVIAGAPVGLGEDGVARRMVDAGGLGEHTVPVRISFKDLFGKDQVVEKTITYRVGQSNASIALDKMNVLYIGVDNPVTIAASGGGDDRVQASISGGSGSLSRVGNGKYIARVGSVTDECYITVTVDGKVAGKSLFRVRTIPKPVATVGGVNSGENMTAAAFRAQQGVAAWIKDFPFDLKYTVTQFTISTDTDEGDIVEAPCTGNAFSPRALQIIRDNVKSGKTVYIDNIRAQGPDGVNNKIPSILYYIK